MSFCCILFFFFFKQKTAYEMRISDWSSDVCSSDLVIGSADPEQRISAWLSRIHGSLLIGRTGGLLVELAASWAIVMILTGLTLWWPRGRGEIGRAHV